MNIAVKRTGGFAGRSEYLGSVDTERLDPASAQQIEQMVLSIGFFDLSSNLSKKEAGADLFCYEVTVSSGSRRHTITFVEDDQNPEAAQLHKLVESLNLLS